MIDNMNDIDNFENLGYVHVQNFLEEELVEICSLYFENKIRRGLWEQNLNGKDVTSFSYYADPLTEVLLIKKLPFVSKVCGKKLYPTYTYSRIYQPGEELKSHVDRPSCEISVTINIASLGEISPIWMQYKNNQAKSIFLNPGDAIIYKGCEAFHWRNPIKENQLNVQFMMHYVDSDGLNAEYKFDKRLKLGFQKV